MTGTHGYVQMTAQKEREEGEGILKALERDNP